MNFDFNEEQYAFRDSVRTFLADTSSRVAIPAASRATIDRERWSGLAELGLFSILVPEQYGGLGLNFVDLCLALEELGGSLVSPLLLDTLVATDLIVNYGSEEQRSRMLPGMARGTTSVAVAMNEPNGGYELSDMSSIVEPPRTAAKSLLSGTKILVADADAADFLLFAARPAGAPNPCLSIIDTGRTGMKLREHQTLDLGSRYCQIDAMGVEVSDTDMVGQSSSAPLERLFDSSAFTAAIMMMGIAVKVLDSTIEYVKHRNQFGRAIGSFQAIKHRCADMAVAVDFGRSAAYYAAWSVANDALDRSKAVSIAKSFCADACRMVCNESTQLHGGMGFTWDLGLHFYLRRAKVLECSYGDSTFHRRRVLCASLSELGIRR